MLACLVYSGSEIKIKEVIQQLKGFAISDFREQVTERKLSLLHIAVIQGRDEIAKELIESGLVPLDAQDCRGWTALHFAAATCNCQMIEFLQNAGVNTSIRNDLGGTADDIWNMIHATQRDPKEYTIYCDEKPINGYDFKKLTGANYSEEVLTDPKILAKNWSLPSSNVGFVSKVQQKIASKYESFRSGSPKVYMTDVVKNDFGESVTGVGFVVCAAIDIEPFEIVDEYVGEEIDEPENQPQGAIYRMGTIDADGPNKIRNTGPLVADSFPNCFSTGVWVNGRKRYFIISIEKIRKGELIAYDYVNHPVKFNGHKELRPQALREFFHINPVLSFCEKIGNHHSMIDAQIYDHPEFPSFAKFIYLMHTPSAIVDLILRRIITVDQLNRFMSSSTAWHKSSMEKLRNRGLFENIDRLLGDKKSEREAPVLLESIEQGEISDIIETLANSYGDTQSLR